MALTAVHKSTRVHNQDIYLLIQEASRGDGVGLHVRS